jgi:hypothetical protein
MGKITNTANEAYENPIIGLVNALNIPAQEKMAQAEACNSSQLPSKHGYRGDAKLLYEALGIKVIGKSNGDDLFLDVILPEGWKIRPTDHSMWNELRDHKDRTRATFFYKGAFYDRDAFINPERRYNMNMISYLSREDKGHFEDVMVKVLNPAYENSSSKLSHRMNDRGDVWWEDGNGNTYTGHMNMRETMEYRRIKHGLKYVTQTQRVWVPKYKNDYVERNKTPRYYEITDCGKVIFSTKDTPAFFKKRYNKNKHSQWWEAYDAFEQSLRAQAEAYLDERYPQWKDHTSYWD